MAFEINYKKDGDAYNSADERENNAFSYVMALNFAIDNTRTNQDNLIADNFGSDSAASKTNMRYDSSNNRYEFIRVDDEIDDSDLSPHWSADTSGGGTVTENSDRILVEGSNTDGTTDSANVTSSGSTPIDYSTGSDVYVRVRVVTSENIGGGASGGSATTRWGLTDGSNNVWLWENTTSGAGNSDSDDSVWDIFIDASAETVDLYDDGSSNSTGVDISSLTGGNYYFIGQAEGSNGDGVGDAATGRVQIHYLYSLGVGYSDGVVETSATSTSNDVDVVILKAVISNVSDTNSVFEASSDNGANYQSISHKELAEITNVGQNVKFKLKFTAPTSITSEGNKVFGYLTDYAAYYS